MLAVVAVLLGQCIRWTIIGAVIALVAALFGVKMEFWQLFFVGFLSDLLFGFMRLGTR